MLWHGLCDKGPKGAGVIELTEMAKLVDDNIVGEVRGEKRDFIVEIEIAFAGTTSPSRALVANSDAVPCESIV